MENKKEEKKMVYGEAHLKISKSFLEKIALLKKQLNKINFVGEVKKDESNN